MICGRRGSRRAGERHSVRDVAGGLTTWSDRRNVPDLRADLAALSASPAASCPRLPQSAPPASDGSLVKKSAPSSRLPWRNCARGIARLVRSGRHRCFTRPARRTYMPRSRDHYQALTRSRRWPSTRPLTGARPSVSSHLAGPRHRVRPRLNRVPPPRQPREPHAALTLASRLVGADAMAPANTDALPAAARYHCPHGSPPAIRSGRTFFLDLTAPAHRRAACPLTGITRAGIAPSGRTDARATRLGRGPVSSRS